MARSIDLFVDSDDDPHQLLVLAGKAAHNRAKPVTDGRWALQFGAGLVAHLYRHPYIDDGDLHLTRYPWVLSVRVDHEGSLLEHPAILALRTVADELRRSRYRVLLVVDLQYRLDLGPDPAAESTASGNGAANPSSAGVADGGTTLVAEPKPDPETEPETEPETRAAGVTGAGGGAGTADPGSAGGRPAAEGTAGETSEGTAGPNPATPDTAGASTDDAGERAPVAAAATSRRRR